MAGVNVCIKCSMFIFNFVFWLCGAIILSIAISIRAGKIGQERTQKSTVVIRHVLVLSLVMILVPGDANLSPFIVVNMLIFVGAVIMILGFLGCCGAMKENQFMMILFFIGLLMILLLQVAAGILATTSKSKSCFASISHIFSRRFFIVIALAFGLAAIEVLGLIFSIVLYCQMRKK
ncbi:tetraspanin-8 [Dama dama]